MRLKEVFNYLPKSIICSSVRRDVYCEKCVRRPHHLQHFCKAIFSAIKICWLVTFFFIGHDSLLQLLNKKNATYRVCILMTTVVVR